MAGSRVEIEFEHIEWEVKHGSFFVTFVTESGLRLTTEIPFINGETPSQDVEYEVVWSAREYLGAMSSSLLTAFESLRGKAGLR